MAENDDYKTLKNELKDIKYQLGIIIDKLNALEDLKLSSHKLDSHIEFIEQTYDTLVQPLNYIKNTVNKITGYENGDLLTLK